MGVFYGQCAALTHLLLTKGAPDRLHRFASILPTVGATAALKATYGINGIGELEEIWFERGPISPIRPVASRLPSVIHGDQFELASVKP
jgi:hypothetical protein